jgi:molybdopterin converting factor small subunit
MAVVVLPRSLVALFPGAERQATVDGTSVAEVIDALDARWPGIRDRLCESGPSIRAFINVYVDRQPAGLGSPVRADSIIHVLPAVAGG